MGIKEEMPGGGGGGTNEKNEFGLKRTPTEKEKRTTSQSMVKEYKKTMY